MAGGTGTDWTSETWNPTGRDRISAGCDHCYAPTMAGRLKLMGSPKYQADGDPHTSGPRGLVRPARHLNKQRFSRTSLAERRPGDLTNRAKRGRVQKLTDHGGPK
jgi:protein gp37